MAETALQLAQQCKQAALYLQSIDSQKKNQVLTKIKQQLQSQKHQIKVANDQDLSNAREMVAEGSLSQSTYKRLDLFGSDDSKFQALVDGIDSVISMQDPIGKVTLATRLDDGLDLYRVTCPVGALLVIFEARPEVLIQITSLCIKSGNAVILKGGKESSSTLTILHQLVVGALQDVGINQHSVQLIYARQQVDDLLKMDDYLDLVIPRGSKQLVTYIKDHTRIPVLGHADGICAIYVDETADIENAVNVIIDSKTNYPAACNAVETVLIHNDRLKDVLPALVSALIEKSVEVRLSTEYNSYLSPELSGKIKAAQDSDFDTEFSDLIIAIKSISNISEAIQHINTHGSKHTDAIITEDKSNAELFMNGVDSAGVYWNASTRFADGFRYGFGAEIGVSTNKTHARGPVGLEGLTIYKYRLYGNGQCVSTYSGGKPFKHEPLPFSI